MQRANNDSDSDSDDSDDSDMSNQIALNNNITSNQSDAVNHQLKNG